MPKQAEEYSPAGNIAFGLFMIVVGVGAFLYFAYLENHGGHIRTHALILLVYGTLGKWGVLGLFGGLGAIIFGKGIWGIVKSKSDSSSRSS